MKPDYLIRCARYKYKTILDKGKWEAPNTQEEQIIVLHAQLNTLKTQSKRGGGCNKRSSKGKKSTGKYSQTKGQSKTKKDFSWQTAAPTAGQPKIKSKWGKEYHRYSTATCTPSEAGCNR